ncbi:sodium:proton exchanger [Burkholderia pseudomultivorans]|uniref:Sodium, potassium, lithium and rubidium/H(+) antiporter n=1 Tax=Burkholderia pseudomultivorans TaxID=1207504 RepID=A0ABU2DWT8_9BURK|nr:sodium:proton antiporter [Burkholderia pseudomultivorans]KVC22395.1 sodium:proton exchanger [Burkholderia pseudomultivorans]KVC37582.1 sodium:proton exchanger [Burkholderia pseudomultivorans]KVC55273.1 sodium:proton exchanger [Burkholderia pseudomultivorans]MDR8727571.1 Sodium, potassium, lithium and rubidium/H(+) antiporter [Burkholderia pseudomultivorans]MDR8734551.1 Sodium, potassium, lithium and rubidium/H(+) antiporter [Burkholderia pseudomultivorans]
MSNVELFHYLLLLICGAGALTWLAERVSIPPAVVLLLGGCVVAVAGRRVPDMDPALLLAAVLPPLLMSSGFYTAWKEFRHELASIASLALGAVAFTTAAVAVAVHAANPAMPWAACFTLGAIVSPPDAVAAKAILQRYPLPARLVAVLEGESLVNDASGLLLYQMAVSATLAVAITTASATGLFFSLTLIGIAIGLACGHAMSWAIPRVRDPMLGIVVTFVMAWASYGIAEAVHGSGVLSVVTCGLVLGVRQHRVFDADLRIKAKATWEAIVFVLDALVFILIGLALHGILARVNHEGAVLIAGLRVALPATAAAIAARVVWVLAAMWLPGKLRTQRPDRPRWSFREAVVLGWSGMRGVVSLAAALALPTDFPGRDLIVFSTFLLIIATLVLQGGTLAPMIRLLKLRPAARHTMSEHAVRAHTFGASLAALERRGSDLERAALDRLLAEYRNRVTANEGAHLRGAARADARARMLRVELELVGVSRQALLDLHRDGKVDDAVLHRIESELDFEELRLQRLLEP